MTTFIDPPPLSIVAEAWWVLKSKENRNPTWLQKFLLLFVFKQETLSPEYMIHTYKPLSGKVFNVTNTGWQRISVSQYKTSFGITEE